MTGVLAGPGTEEATRVAEQPVNLAIIGCGSIGRRHAAALRRVPSARLVAVSDLDAERAAPLARAHDASLAASPADLWQRPDLDAVILATPTDTHHSLALAAAAAGKHVLVEKPAALTLPELDEMQRAAAAAGVVLLVGQTLRFHQVARALHRCRLEGDVGQPVFFNWVTNSARAWPAGWRAWQTDPARSGGMALHLGIHGIDLALWLLDSPPERVYAQGANLAAPGLAVYDSLQIGLRCANGANALVEVHLGLPAKDGFYQAASLLGTRGQAEWSLSDDGRTIDAAGVYPLCAGSDQSLADELAHFVNCCQRRGEPEVTATQARWALAAAIAATRSLASGQPVAVGDRPAEGWP